MAFPTIVGSAAESATTSAGTSHVVNLPAGAAGNLFLLFMSKGDAAVTINALAGWNELLDESSSWSGFCAWRRCDGTEGATTTFTSSGSVKTATIVYEINGDSAVAPQISAVATGSSNAPNPNSLSPTGGAKDYLWFTWFVLDVAGEEADDDTWCNNAATNYGNLLQKTAGTAGTNIGTYVAVCHRTNNASSEDAIWPSGTTDVSTGWRAYTVAVHPLQLVSADTGAFTESGIAATLAVGRATTASPGSFALTGVAATLVVDAPGGDTPIIADTGSFTESGVAATLVAGRALPGGAATGSLSETGIAATLVAGRALPGGAATGAYALSGVAATLVVTPVGAVSITADPGSYALSGVDATLVVTGSGPATQCVLLS